MLNFIKNFAHDESGAVTVDWVVLTAAIVGLGIVIINSVGTGAADLAGDIQTGLTTMEVTTDTDFGGAAAPAPANP